MTQQTSNMNYSVATGSNSTSGILTYITTTSPTVNDVNYPIGKRWVNSSNATEYILTSFSSASGVLQATWTPLEGSGAAESFVTNVGGPVTPTSSGAINLNASTTTYTNGSTANTVKTEVQAAAYNLIIGAGTNTPATSLSPGTTGNALVSQGASSNPAYAVLGVVGGGTGLSTQNAYAVLVAGTTTTAAMQSLPSNGTSGQFLTSAGASAIPTWSTPTYFRTLNVQKFTSSGTYTPTAGMKYCVVECIGGGGGGGGASANAGATVAAGSGGGGGGYARVALSAASIGASQAVTVGLPGAGGAAGDNDGNVGGTTSLGSLCAASGGGGGTGAPSDSVISNFSGADNGVGTIGDVLISGITGMNSYGIVLTGIGIGNGGDGGSGFYGGNGMGGRANQANSDGSPGTNYGAGGGGGMSGGSGANAAAGGNGFQGIVIVTEFIS